jgi:hypothetical protein
MGWIHPARQNAQPACRAEQPRILRSGSWWRHPGDRDLAPARAASIPVSGFILPGSRFCFPVDAVAVGQALDQVGIIEQAR